MTIIWWEDSVLLYTYIYYMLHTLCISNFLSTRSWNGSLKRWFVLYRNKEEKEKIYKYI